MSSFNFHSDLCTFSPKETLFASVVLPWALHLMTTLHYYLSFTIHSLLSSSITITCIQPARIVIKTVSIGYSGVAESKNALRLIDQGVCLSVYSESDPSSLAAAAQSKKILASKWQRIDWLVLLICAYARLSNRAADWSMSLNFA